VVAEKLDIKPCLDALSLSLTARQAEAIATVAIETCMLDLHGENLAFLGDRKVAIIDTEPVTRKSIKEIRAMLIVKLRLVDVSLVKFTLGILGTLQLKEFANSLSAKRMIEKVQWKYLSRKWVESAAKISVLAIGVFLLRSYPIFIVTPLVQIILLSKMTLLATQVIGGLYLWNSWSNQRAL
jgi:hypothetical protein